MYIQKVVIYVQIKKNRLIKFELPNKKALDINSDVLKLLSEYKQIESNSAEAGGFLIGYTQKQFKNVIVEYITKPQKLDYRSRLAFRRKDRMHFKILNVFRGRKSDYLGTWHSHPQKVPSPSKIDLDDWRECLLKEKTNSGYIIFLILGTDEFRVWAGDLSSREIVELHEWPHKNGIYNKECYG